MTNAKVVAKRLGGGFLLTLGLLMFLGVFSWRSTIAQTGCLRFEQASWSFEANMTSSLAWGDYDNDGDLDLAVGNGDFEGPHTYIGRFNHLYRNDNGRLTATPVWTSDYSHPTTSVAWGDYDGDGDLDLAVGNSYDGVQPGLDYSRIYRNVNGTLETTSVWTASVEEYTQSIVWGDYDGDGDLDLAVGNGSISIDGEFHFTPVTAANYLLRNEGTPLDGTPQFTKILLPLPDANQKDYATRSLNWGDYDNDGDLDLAIGNFAGRNRVYRNEGINPQTGDPIFTIWEVDQPGERNDQTNSVAWGDLDSDGQLELAVGNGGLATEGGGASGHPNRLYRAVITEDGTPPIFQSDPDWPGTQLPEADSTISLAWGDYDNDGDLDLVVGNVSNDPESDAGAPNRLYRNDNGGLTLSSDWIIPEEDGDTTSSIAWGDYDGDGDLDIVVGNIDLGTGQENLLYRNIGSGFRNAATFSETNFTTSFAWGDYDQDQDLDIVEGAGDGILEPDTDLTGQNYLYHNQNGILTITQAWLPAITNTQSVAWGDFDADGDLDLAVGIYGAANQVFSNENGLLSLNWLSDEADLTTSLAWGDYDGDGDLDLAVGNDGQNRVYEYDQTAMILTNVWTATEASFTLSLAWGDVDDDGDLDLAVGNMAEQSHLYLNRNGTLSADPVWTSAEVTLPWARSVAWGDYDGDGDLDLAVGNGGTLRNLVYDNLGRMLEQKASWRSDEIDGTSTVVWRDYDVDGDLDLIVGNDVGGRVAITDPWTPLSEPNYIYPNYSGTLQTKGLKLPEEDSTKSLALGDYDGDGDLDMMSGNFAQPNRLLENQRRTDVPQFNDPPYVRVFRPGNTPDAALFAVAEIITQAQIPITYQLFDPEGDAVPKIFAEYSLNGGGQWLPATISPFPGGQLTDLAASPNGTTHTLLWHAEEDKVIKSDMVVFRITAHASYSHSPMLWPAVAGQSPLFRVEAPWYIRVVDEQENPVEGARVFYDGQAIGYTNHAGLLKPDAVLTPGHTLVAMALVHTQPTRRELHPDGAYQTYITSVSIDPIGTVMPFTIDALEGEQRLIVHAGNSLTLFDMVVSIEWDATEAYVQEVITAARHAADFLYDVTDGQMAFNQITIYDEATYWSDADIQISTRNDKRPRAYMDGIRPDKNLYAIEVGRYWSGNDADQGSWSESAGYRTLVHEFGHYGLALYDEYFGYEVRGSDFIGELEASCTDDRAWPVPVADPGWASIMDYQYQTSEFADETRWTSDCQETAQAQLNDGEADWQTIVRLYKDKTGQNRWRLITPTIRTGIAGQAVPGPETIPSFLPFPTVEGVNGGLDPEPFTLTVCLNGEPYQDIARVFLRANNKNWDQGITNASSGEIEILGAKIQDEVIVTSRDRSWRRSSSVSALLALDGCFEIGSNKARLQNQATSFFKIWPTTTNDQLDGLELVVTVPFTNEDLTYLLTEPEHSQLGASGLLLYSNTANGHQGQVDYVPQGQTGNARAFGGLGSQFVDISIDYRLYQATPFSLTTFFSNDSRLKLLLPAGAINTNTSFAIASAWGVPGPPPSGLEIVGEAYQITASGPPFQLQKPAILNLHYDMEAGLTFEQLDMYRWDDQTSAWYPLGGELKINEREVVTTTVDLGIYILLGKLLENVEPPHLIIGKTAPAVVSVGELITYTLMVTNTGAGTATNLLLTDTLPVGAYYVDSDEDGQLIEQTLHFTLPVLPPNAVATRTFWVTATTTLTNSVYQVRADGGFQAIGRPSVVTMVEPPHLIIGKTAPVVVSVGELITYTLMVTNTGTGTATNLLLTDILPVGAYYVDSDEDGQLIEQTLHFTLPVLPPNAVATRTFWVTATTTLTNSLYQVRADGGLEATGSPAVTKVGLPQFRQYLPLLMKE